LRFLFLRIEARFADLLGLPRGLPFRATLSVHPCGSSFRVLLSECPSGPPLFRLSLRSAFPGFPFGPPSLAVPCGLPWLVFQSNGLPLAPAYRPWSGICIAFRCCCRTPSPLPPFGATQFGPGFRSASAFRFQRRLPPWSFSRFPVVCR
jgi:hypothetical protein